MSTSYAPGGSQYLQNPATENLDMNSFGIKFGSIYDVGIVPVTGQIRIVNNALQAGTTKDFMCKQFSAENMAYLIDGYIRSQANFDKFFELWAYNNASWEAQIKMLNESSSGAGDGGLIMANLPTIDPADGLSKIWSNGGVLTLGT